MSASTADLQILQTAAGHVEETTEQSAAGAYRDIHDIRMLRHIAGAVLIQSFLLVASLGVIVYLATKPPQQVVIERTGDGDRVVGINGQAVSAGVVLAADRPGAGDKKTLAREWAASRYGIDPLTREKDLERMFKMMAPRTAKAYSDLMMKNRELERERGERWQAVWQPQVVELDAQDPYKVKVVGTWEISKTGTGRAGAEREVKQLMFVLHLLADTDKGRAPRNVHTGFLVDDVLDYRELPVAASSPSALKAQ